MALEYDLNLSADIGPTQGLEALCGNISGLILTWNGKNGYYLWGSTIEIDVGKPSEMRQDIINEGFRFVPTLSVRFRFNNNTDYDVFRQIVFQATMLLLEHAQDAVLLFNYEIIVLQRLQGKLTFNSEYRMWDEAWLKSRIKASFEFRPLPSPLL